MLDEVREATRIRSGRLPSNNTIWNAIRNYDIDRKVRAFLFQALHDSHRVGKYWQKIPQYEHRAQCNSCNKIESMTHILTECQNTGQQQIWTLASQVLQNRGITIGEKTIGNVLSCCMPNIKLPNGRADKARNRLYTIIVTESLYLIWLIRCEWKIEKEEEAAHKHSQQEIKARWNFRINRRIRLDQAMGSRRPHDWRRLDKRLVLNTWRGSLTNEAQLPKDWIREKGVLVSTEDMRPPGRNR